MANVINPVLSLIIFKHFNKFPNTVKDVTTMFCLDFIAGDFLFIQNNVDTPGNSLYVTSFWYVLTAKATFRTVGG